MKSVGLGSGEAFWTTVKGQNIGGLGSIQKHLQEHNEELPKQTKLIDAAIDDIRYELFQVGIRLNHKNETDDVIDQLDWLRRKIGMGDAKTGNLKHMYDTISRLQSETFTEKPNAVGKATTAMEAELKRLQSELQGDKDKHSGVISALSDLKKEGLGAEKWVKENNTKGLEKIEKELNAHLSDISSQPGFIELGIERITKQLDELRTALQGSSGDPKDDVINSLDDFLSFGLNSTDWQNGKPGLGQIKQDIQGQNAKFSQASDRIELATNRVLRETEDMLRKVQNKLGPELVPYDTITSYLRQLKEKIGKENGNGEGLQGIQREISRMQGDAFKSNPEKIEQAEKVIRQELEKLKGNLQNEVTKTLNELMEQGLGDSEKVIIGGKNVKGFDHIKNHLQRQQSDLSTQPEQIDLGMKDITNELDEVRRVLQGTANDKPENRGVIHNLVFMTKHMGNNDNEGLKKIKSDMEALKKDQGNVITDNLGTMSLAIQKAGAYAGWNLGELENPHIDGKLRDIQSDLTNLRLTDLAAAIKLCDDFLIKADEIERNTVKALWKHVDHEVDDAINDLTKEARQHYVDSVKEALELFAKKVNEDLEQLPNEINRDRYIGYKGFMNAVEGVNSGNINRLTCMKSRELKHLSAAFASFFGTVNDYVRKEITRLHDEQNKEKNPSLPPTAEPYTPKLNDVYEALTAVLAYLKDYDGGTDRLTELVERLTKALGNLAPSDFKHPSTPLLDTVSRGLSEFAGEFSNTYISTYSGQRCREEHAHKYAKVLLSMIPMTHKALSKLVVKCENEWKSLHICEFTADDKDNPLGNYLTRCGYRVSSNYAVQGGELNHMFTGAGIHELLTTPIEDVGIEMHLEGEPIKNRIDLVNIISLLYNTLCQYFQASHIYVHPDPRYPCTVRDMLSWLSGLQYTQVADKLPDHCKALLNRRCHDGHTPNKEDQVMAKCIGELPYIIATTCSRSTALLTAIQGNGHGFDLAAYPYSVDFSNNRARLHYPTNPAELLDTLREIACRLCKVLYFLYSQCCRSTARVKGWRECAYGRQVQSHNWQCKQLGTSSTTTTKHGCPPTSPLQSFLSDSCHGLLPHTLTAADMKIECANCLANQPGQQCLTPLGFWDIGFAASISGTGWDLASHLGDMCRDADSCLFVLCRTLFLLCPTAPSSLADVFALYAQVLRRWDPHDRVKHRGGTYTDASDFISHLNTDGIDSLFPLWKELHGGYENGKLTTAIASLAGHDHKSHGALSSLFKDSTCKSPSRCAPYLQPLGLHANHTYPQKHAGLYITWIIYLAWQFWELLTHLLHALDNIDCTASGCATCPCQPGTHGGKDACHCPSLVQCAGILPTLYRYGFTYPNANLLVTDNRAMRCGDLNAQLKEALHSDHFTELFRQIDQLMWHIRMPFLYCFVALWSLVMLYLLHTFLYRMDILRIRSHLLTTKASHRIDVKALLSDNKKMLSLYDASYFDDDPNELLNFK